MILRICPYQILKNKSLSENNFKHCKLPNLACKDSCTEKKYIIQSSMLSKQ